MKSNVKIVSVFWFLRQFLGDFYPKDIIYRIMQLYVNSFSTELLWFGKDLQIISIRNSIVYSNGIYDMDKKFIQQYLTYGGKIASIATFGDQYADLKGHTVIIDPDDKYYCALTDKRITDYQKNGLISTYNRCTVMFDHTSAVRLDHDKQYIISPDDQKHLKLFGIDTHEFVSIYYPKTYGEEKPKYLMGITSDGELYSIGINSDGVTGVKETHDKIVPTRVPLPEPVVSMACIRYGHIIALTATGAVYIWERYLFWHYRGTNAVNNAFELVPKKIWDNVKIVVCDQNYSVCMKYDDTVHAWKYGKSHDNTTNIILS